MCKEFQLTFTLAEHLQVSEAKFENGLLHIDLVRQVPEALQPQRIAIGATPEQPNNRLKTVIIMRGDPDGSPRCVMWRTPQSPVCPMS